MQKNYTNYNKGTWGQGAWGHSGNKKAISEAGRAGKAKGNFGSWTKKAVKTFQDLEVYQKSLEASVFAANEIVKKCEIEDKDGVDAKIIECLTICAMKIPHLIAESHSTRFGESTKCLDILDQTMLQCNKAVVYIEQTRDIVKPGAEWEKFDELIQKYFYIRRKVLNLQRVWKKYIFDRPASDIAS